MSTPLALAAVTSVLQTSLNFLYTGSVFGTITVSAIAPDLVESRYGIGADATPLVNLFLHQVTPNAAWRNMDLPSLAADGATRTKNPQLALDLHYLLTAYASDDTQAEGLLGYALLMLHENPILPRAVITNILATLPVNAYNDALRGAGVEAQIEMIKLTPSTLGREEMAWLWTALKADYRLTFPFQASVVLMRNENATAFSLPVLTRNIAVRASGPAHLIAVQPPNDQFAAAVGDRVTITGMSLTGANRILLSNPVARVSYRFAPGVNDLSNVRLSFAVPDAPAQMPCGVCQASLLFLDGGGNVTAHTNAVTLGIGLVIAAVPAPAAAAAGGGTQVDINCNPAVQPGQRVTLVVGEFSATAQPFAARTASLSFQFTPALPAGTYATRLVVDGVMPPVAQNWQFTPPGTIVVM